MIASAGPWAAVGATTRGSRHVRSAAPNQDAVVVASVGPSGGGSALIAAVADGHGSVRHVRSDRGSRLAVDVVRTAVDATLDRRAIASVGRADRWARTVLAPEVVARWRVAVLDDVARDPFTVEERDRAGVHLDDAPLIAYGSTVIAAIMTPRTVVLLQLGDGDVVLGHVDGRASRPMPHDPRLVGGETTSLCLPEAVQDARIVVTEARDCDLVVLATDGYGVAFAQDDWAARVIADLRRTVAVDGIERVDDSLGDWIAPNADVGGDDVSVIVAHRPGAQDDSTHRPVRGRVPRAAAALVLAGMVVAGTLAVVRPGRTTADEPGPPPSGAPAPDPGPAVVPADAVTLGIPGGASVTFRPDPAAPRPRRATVPTSPAAGLRPVIDVDGVRWTIEDGLLVAASPDDRIVRTAAALGAAVGIGPTLWAIDSSARWLFVIDPSGVGTCRVVPVDGAGVEESDPPSCEVERPTDPDDEGPDDVVQQAPGAKGERG